MKGSLLRALSPDGCAGSCLELAQRRAAGRGAKLVDVDDLVWALTHPSSAVSRFFIEEQGVAPDPIYIALRLPKDRSVSVSPASVPRSLLRQADTAAARVGSSHIRPEHLLLVTLRHEPSHGARLLRKAGLRVRPLEAELRRISSGIADPTELADRLAPSIVALGRAACQLQMPHKQRRAVGKLLQRLTRSHETLARTLDSAPLKRAADSLAQAASKLLAPPNASPLSLD